MTAFLAFPFNLFRAYDIRGHVNQLTPNVVQSIAYALIHQLKAQGQQQLVIGYDARLNSPQYAAIIADIAVKAGLTLTELGCCSTPLMYFHARNHAGNGIMVTASHNPKHDNGLKWLIQGMPPTPAQIQNIAQLAAQHYVNHNAVEPLPHWALLNHQMNDAACQSYRLALLEDIQLKRPLRVVLDALHGSAGLCAKHVLEQLGCHVHALRCDANGHFPDHAPDPSHAAHLRLLQQQIVAQQADVGIALDGDGDRVVMLDQQGHIISPDRLLSLCAAMCLSQHPQREVVFDVKCSKMVYDTITQHGGKPTMLRTGSSFLRQYLSQSNGQAIFGGEYAGHYVFNDGRGLGYDDGLYAALRVLEYWTDQPQQTFSQLLAVYPERASTEDIYIPTYQHPAQAVFAQLIQNSGFVDAILSQIDGVRLDFKDGFGIMRASNTGDYFTVRFDAVNVERLNTIRDIFVSLLDGQYPDIAQDIRLTQRPIYAGESNATAANGR